MAALVQLKPTLPQDIDKKHGVTINGFHETSSVIRFDGASSAVTAARNEVDKLLSQAKISKVTLAFPHSLLSLAKKQLKFDNCQVYIGSETILDTTVMVMVYSFDEQNLKKSLTLLQTVPTKKEVAISSAVVKKLSDIDIHIKRVEEKFCTLIEQHTTIDIEDGKLIVNGFQHQGVKEAHKELLGLMKEHSEQCVTLDCKPEEVLYLLKICKETRSLFSSLPAKITIRGDVIELFGNVDSIEKSKDKILNGPLSGLQYRTFLFRCNAKFLTQIEICVLKPLIDEEKLNFHFWIVKPKFQSSSKGDKEPRREELSETCGFEITIYSKDKDAFEKVCDAMKVLDPKTQQFHLSYRGAADCARKLKETLEGKFHVRIIVQQGNHGIIIHGLIPDEIQQCWEDINNEIRCTIDTVKHVHVKRHESKFLEHKRSNDLKKDLSCDIAFPYQKKTDSYSIRFTGKIKDVEAAESKVLEIIEAGINVLTFAITCNQRAHSMWRKWWFDFKKQEEETHDVMIHFEVATRRQNRDGTNINEVMFEVIGTNMDQLKSIKDAINSERTEKRVISVSEEGKVALRNVVRQQRLPISDKLAIGIDIDPFSNKITLVSPKSLSDDLNTAESEIHKFVGMYANTSKEVVSDDRVVGLILTSSPKSLTYIKSATDIAKLHKVSVKVLHAPLFGLKLTGSPLAIQTVEPQIHSTVYKQIERIIDETQLHIPSTYAAILTSSEFSNIETKLQDDYCVILSYQRPGVLSKAVYSTLLIPNPSVHSVQLDICQGDIVQERIDAIVNAANEELQHIGGLAKSIVDHGGVAIQSECSRYVHSNGKVATGSCVCLGAGKLPCKRIIHAVGPQWHRGERNEEKTLHDTVYKCMQCADKDNLTSIALPAISTGVFGVPERVCARASLTAVCDYCQSNPDSNISAVRFVLYTNSALDEFGLAIQSIRLKENYIPLFESEKTQPKTNFEQLKSTIHFISPKEDYKPLPSSKVERPKMIVEWSWENDVNSYTPYRSDVSARLTKAYKSNPTSSTTCIINGKSYTIDFSTMIQTNCITGFTRKVRHIAESSYASLSTYDLAKNVHWEYTNDNHGWCHYRSHESQAIEEMYQDDTPGELTIVGNVYGFDFKSMYQINTQTNYKRQIRRVEDILCSSSVTSKQLTLEEEHTSDSKHKQHSKGEGKLTVTLRGPRDALQQAKHKLEVRLKEMYTSHTVPFPPALEKKLSQIVKEYKVIWSFEKGISGGKKKRKRKMFKLNIEGLASEVSSAMVAIQEEVITHQIESKNDNSIDYPEEWEETDSEATTKVFFLNEGTDEWNHVARQFKLTMPASRIIQITRIQNKWLWEKYMFQYKRLDIKNKGKVNELELFHGTRGNDPKVIYESEVGFDMRYSSIGMWGQANYFAQNSRYSHGYAHSTSDGFKEMFLVKVLTGESSESPSDQTLRKPPFKDTNAGSTEGGLQFAQVQYDTVTGYTNGSQVYMTYDNEKAYPAYLIKYSY